MGINRKHRAGLPPAPNPARFIILKYFLDSPYAALLVHYTGCTNYEGKKLLILEGVFDAGQVRNMRMLDPHFTDERHAIRVIARLEPTAHGMKLAEELIRLLKQKIWVQP